MYTVKNIRFERNDELGDGEYRDEYERKQIAEKILTLINNNNISPLFIDGAWGAGKSEFCYKLFHFLRDSNEQEKSGDSLKLIVSYINSFAGDYQSNPFMLIVQAIYNCLITKDASSSDICEVQKVLSKGLSFTQMLFVAGFRGTNLKIGSPFFGAELEFSGKDAADAVKEGKNNLDKDFGGAFFAELESFRQQSEQLMKFKSAISEAIGDRKIVLIIDELDRCRPDYALELLENVKHIFEIENLFIIFSANKKQLEAMIHKRYGYGMDAEGYLEKFYKETIFLTSKIAEKSIEEEGVFKGHLTVFCRKLGRITRNNPGYWGELQFRGLSFVKELLGTVEPRQVEKVADRLNLYCSITGKKLDNMSKMGMSLVILGAFLSVIKQELLRNIESKTVQSELLAYLSEFQINHDVKAIMLQYVTEDLKRISARRREPFLQEGSPSIIQEVSNILV